jgi:hypothetical protein
MGGKEERDRASQLFSKAAPSERWELTMRKTIIRSTNVVESGIRQIRDAKAGRDCLCVLSAARHYLARLNQSLNAAVHVTANATVERLRHFMAAAAGMHATGETSLGASESFASAAMPQWFGMQAVVVPQGTPKPATPSGRVS